MKQFLILVMLSGLLLTACSGTPTPNLAVTAQTAATATQLAQLTDTPTPKPTGTPTPTDTPLPPTDTPVPPTDTPIPPTETPIPPTKTPVPPTETTNPQARDAVIAFLRAVNDQDVEAALVLFSEDAELIFEGASYKGKERIRELLTNEVDIDARYKFSEYGMNGDNITWRWTASWTIASGGTGRDDCEGEATISDGQIHYLRHHHCREG